MRRGVAPVKVASATAEVGLVLDRYHLVEQIGQGGMAQVFHARKQGIGGFERDVAVKVLLPEYASESDFVGMLLDEARIAGAILHPCVVGVLDVGRHRDLFYLVMEYVDGCDLRAILRTQPGGRIKQPAALYMIGEVLRGLSAVHSAVDGNGQPRRIIHRDVSPANVLIDRAGVVKLGDFGIAHASSRITLTRPGAVKGKLRYMAPEQLGGQPVDQRADLFAVGVVLLEMLMGPEACESKRMSAYGPVFSWSRTRAAGVPADLLEIFDRALAERPQDRYRDAASFRRDLAAALHRRSPGYGAEELARELALTGPAPAVDARRPPSLHDLLDVSDEPARSFLDDQKPTAPFRNPDALRSISVGVAAAYTPPPALDGFEGALSPTTPQVASPTAPYALRSTLAQLPWRRIGLVGGPAMAALLAILLAVTLAAGGNAAPLPPAQAAPVAARGPQSPTVKPLTGRLQVNGPSGTSVIIGTVTYPPAPCEVELPAGQYQVKLVRHGRRPRVTVRNVIIEAGGQVSLRL